MRETAAAIPAEKSLKPHLLLGQPGIHDVRCMVGRSLVASPPPVQNLSHLSVSQVPLRLLPGVVHKIKRGKGLLDCGPAPQPGCVAAEKVPARALASEHSSGTRNTKRSPCPMENRVSRASFHTGVHALLLGRITCLDTSLKSSCSNDLPHQGAIQKEGVHHLNPAVEAGSTDHTKLAKALQLACGKGPLLPSSHLPFRHKPLSLVDLVVNLLKTWPIRRQNAVKMSRDGKMTLRGTLSTEPSSCVYSTT